MTTETVLANYEAANYKAMLFERPEESRRDYKNYPYLVRCIKLTPKAKYMPSKILSNYVYKTIEEAEQAAKTFIENIRANYEARAKRKQDVRDANKNVKASDYYKVGDIIVNSWGWEQTNVNFYQIVKVGNKTIEIQSICSEIVEGSYGSNGMSCNMVAVKDSFATDGDQYKLRVKANGQLSNPESYYYMHKWDGRPQYCSWYA